SSRPSATTTPRSRAATWRPACARTASCACAMPGGRWSGPLRKPRSGTRSAACGVPASSVTARLPVPEPTGVHDGRDGRAVRDIRVTLVLATVDRVQAPMAFVASLAEQIERRFELIVIDQNPDERLGPVIARALAAGIEV